MVPIITIDGPASSGKGTVARRLAQLLGFHYLESGAIYRALGWWIERNSPQAELSIADVIALVDSLHLKFIEGQVWVNGVDVTTELRAERIGLLASKYAALAEVRQRLLSFQREFAQAPGLVTDGRDMGSVVFPAAQLKVFLTASAEKRAERRYNQLQHLDKSVTIGSILQDIIARDEQDSTRSSAPLSYDSSFKVLDNSELGIDETLQVLVSWFKMVEPSGHTSN